MTSVRLTFRLGKSGDQYVEAITEHGCTVHVEAKAGDDGDIVVNAVFDGAKPVDAESQADQAVPRAGSHQIVGVRDRHVIRIGNAEYGCVRVLSHEVSPYNWRLVNFGAREQSVNPDLGAMMQAANAAQMSRNS